MITVKNLRKEYSVAAFGTKDFRRPKPSKKIVAVDNLSFQIEKSESVGYIGANGAGKSTTIKMLSGILAPTSGSIVVDGLIPQKQQKKHAQNIGVVFGQKTQLWWELPVKDSFYLLKKIYHVPDTVYAGNLLLFNEMLDLHQFFDKPVRQLSLGQRIRADFAASLLHNPNILFLDEPTIGLDVLAKDKIRAFINEINKQRGTTVLLTSHDMDDIEQLCRRIMIIDAGNILYDGGIDDLKHRYGTTARITVQFEHPVASDIRLPGCTVEKKDPRTAVLSFSKSSNSPASVLQKLLRTYAVRDLQIQETSIEEIVKEIYRHHSMDSL